MRRTLLKWLLGAFIMLALALGLFRLWNWYTFNVHWSPERGLVYDPVAAGFYLQPSAATYGLLAAFFIFLSCLLIVVIYRLIIYEGTR